MTKKNQNNSLIKTILPIVLAFLGTVVLINMIQEKSVVNGIQAFILGLKNNFFYYFISIMAVIVGTLIGLNIKKQQGND